MTKQLSQIMENFSDWSRPWTFYNSIIGNIELNDADKQFFSKIYKEASDYELWNPSDLAVGAINSTIFLENNTNFNDKTINQIVNAIAYEWR